jgi:hypothetical protein
MLLLQPLVEDRAKVDVYSGANREFVRGRLLEVTPSALVLEGRGGRREVAAAEVREVWSPGGARYRKPLIVGTAVGLSFGLLAKAGEGDCRDPMSLCATDGPVTGTDITIGAVAAVFTVAVAKQRHGALAYDQSRPVPAAPASLTLQPLLSPRAVGVRGTFTF